MAEKNELHINVPESALRLSDDELEFLDFYRSHPEIQQKLQEESKRICIEDDDCTTVNE